jgi:hypothetical protein
MGRPTGLQFTAEDNARDINAMGQGPLRDYGPWEVFADLMANGNSLGIVWKSFVDRLGIVWNSFSCYFEYVLRR